MRAVTQAESPDGRETVFRPPCSAVTASSKACEVGVPMRP